MNFSDKLKELRKEKGISQEELARAVYKSRSTVAKWETGIRLPDEETLELLKEYFGVDGLELSCETPAEETAGDAAASREILTMKKSLTRQKKILIGVCVVLGVVVLAWVAVIVYGLVCMFQPYYGDPAGQSYYGIVKYSAEYGCNLVYVPDSGLCYIPSLDEENHYENSADPSSLEEGDLIRIYFNYKNCPVTVTEAYPASFSAGAWSISVMCRSVRLEENDGGYALTREYDERFAAFEVGDAVYFVLSGAGGDGAEKLTLFCKAEVLEISGGLITMQLPSVNLQKLLTYMSGGFTYLSAEESFWDE